jgi:ribonucleotide reductase beta subunit family protein with ferritin-like domain
MSNQGLSIIHDFNELTFLPIKKQNLIKYYTDLCALTWFPAEIDMSKDRNDFDNQTLDIQHFIKTILAFFAPADGLICENLMSRFVKDTSIYKEAGFFYNVQNFNETIHNQTYSILIDVFIRDEQEKQFLLDSVINSPKVKAIADWMRKWMDVNIPLAERILAFACIEGGVFNGAFASIYWIQKRNILVGLTTANEWIARDEAIHTLFAIELYNTMIQDGYIQPLSETKVFEIIDEATQLTIELTNEALRIDLVGMSKTDMESYIKCTFDNLAVLFGFNKIYNSPNPFDWMLMIGLENKTNFFEKTTTSYTRDLSSEKKWDEKTYY